MTLRKLALAAFLLVAVHAFAVDPTAIDKSVVPGDDFYAYANGGWMKATTIPDDRSSVGVFSVLDDIVSKRNADLIQNAGEGKVGAYYAAFMNEAAIEKRGLTPIKPELDSIKAISGRTSLARVLGHQLRADVDALNNTNFHTDRLFGLWVSPDFSHPSRNVGYLLQGGLGLPDRDYYTNSGAKDVELQNKYKEHIAAVMSLAKAADPEGAAARIYGLEKKIAETHATRTDSVDVNKANNPWPLKEFSKRAPGLDWKTYFEAAGLSEQPKLIVWHPAATTGISALVASEPLSTWKEYLTFRAIDRASGLLPKAFADERFKFYGTALTGATKQRDRWRRAVAATGGALGDEVGKMYVKRYFSPEAKAAAQTMVKNIVAAFRTRVDRLDWMSPATRAKAKAKLDTLYVGIGYPDRWTDYSTLRIDRDDPLGNAQRSSLVEYRRALKKLGTKVDKTEWAMAAQVVNALNLPLQNALNFPAAILNPPFFDVTADAAQNYGAIGSVIGHEISHSFDDQGALFDAEGRLQNWWTPEDFAHFNAASDRLAKQYDAYEPLPGMHVNGKLTLSENIADVAGLSAAYDAYRIAEPDAPTIDGFTGDQRFFVAFAQDWRTKMRPEARRGSLLTDGHAPGEFRADTVRNLDPWYAAFGVEAGRKLYLSPAERVRIW
jgi:putative endopeptidase